MFRAHIATALRNHSIHDAKFGTLYRVFYAFADRTIEEFWTSELHPVLKIDHHGMGTQWACYEPFDGYRVPDVITLNPYGLRNGQEACEAQPCTNNFHDVTFHSLMFDKYGIRTEEENGRHFGNDGRWDEWVDAQTDLKIDAIQFPGPTRIPHEW